MKTYIYIYEHLTKHACGSDTFVGLNQTLADYGCPIVPLSSRYFLVFYSLGEGSPQDGRSDKTIPPLRNGFCAPKITNTPKRHGLTKGGSALLVI